MNAQSLAWTPFAASAIAVPFSLAVAASLFGACALCAFYRESRRN